MIEADFSQRICYDYLYMTSEVKACWVCGAPVTLKAAEGYGICLETAKHPYKRKVMVFSDRQQLSQITLNTRKKRYQQHYYLAVTKKKRAAMRLTRSNTANRKQVS